MNQLYKRLEADRRTNLDCQVSDSLLWRKFLHGDGEAFAKIYEAYAQRLYNFGCQFTTDFDLVKDTLQDLFLQLRCTNANTEVKSIKSYLYKCYYRALTQKLKEAAQIKTLRNNEDAFAIATTASEEVKMINQQITDQQQRYLEKGLNELSFKQRQAILLFYYEGFSYQEIAALFEMKATKSARKLVYRAIDSLRATFTPFSKTFVSVVASMGWLI